ncbi:hypothetical protein N7493_001758 [Penicillium malachiteum]|uniref:Uncharacterized protein n=1 Tax=Penicillium malachiteum TaxID=1324776 RepID=A0AAD6N092_9EURO|nr:hypothetical protein N7493_001758 [Penicillium malachiteum]
MAVSGSSSRAQSKLLNQPRYRTSRSSREKSSKKTNGVTKEDRSKLPNGRKDKSKETRQRNSAYLDEWESDDSDDLGSPWDPTSRKSIKIEDLNLQKSYVEEAKAFAKIIESEFEDHQSEQPERRPRWKHPGKEPLTDISKLIEMEWDTREPDLDPEDLKGQIARCKERIEDNIMPSFFEDRLKRLEAESQGILEIQNSGNELPGLSMNVVSRIAQLRQTKAVLENEGGGSTNQLPNINAILAAYRNKTLDWTGLVTYWSQGKQLCQPRIFDWDEFEAINDAYNGSQGFWVEGYTLAVRIPGKNWWTELEFLYDTGGVDMILFKADLDLIAGPIREPPLRVIEENIVYGVAGNMTTPIVQLEATILDTRGRRLGPWLRVPTRVNERLAPVAGHAPGTRGNPRVDGGVLRQFYYYMTSPDRDITLTIAKSRHGMFPLAGGLSERERIALVETTRQFRPARLGREYALGQLDADGNPTVTMKHAIPI